MGKNLIMTREASLVAIKDWNFMPNDGKVRPILITLPQISLAELSDLVNCYATVCDVDGDVLPGVAILRVFSETMAREFIESYGSKLVNKDVFIDASALGWWVDRLLFFLC